MEAFIERIKRNDRKERLKIAQKAMEKGVTTIIKNMLNLGINIETIQQVTQMPKEKIEKIQEIQESNN